MKGYNPERPVDPVEWNDLDEGERHYLVERYHRKKRIKMPNVPVHAAIHVAVENQVALGTEIPVQKTLKRLIQEGLSRHDAIHAIGSVLAEHMYDLLKHGAKDHDLNVKYYGQLEELTADSWIRGGDEELEDNKL